MEGAVTLRDLLQYIVITLHDVIQAIVVNISISVTAL